MISRAGDVRRIESAAKERDGAFIEAVVNDNWTPFKKYSKKYGVNLPNDEKVMKAGVYKAVQYCIGITNDVKAMAMEKCVELGFRPFMKGL